MFAYFIARKHDRDFLKNIICFYCNMIAIASNRMFMCTAHKEHFHIIATYIAPIQNTI